MGLASYGEPTYLDEFRRIVHSSGLGYDLGLDYFRHHIEGAAMTWDGGSPELPPLWGPGMETLLGPARRSADEPLEDRTETSRPRSRPARGGRARHAADLHAKTGLDALCLAGGVALNCVVNGKIFDETPFPDLYIQPAAYDGGTSVGAAYHVAPREARRPRSFVHGPRVLGPEYSDERMRAALEPRGCRTRSSDPTS